MSKEWHCTEIRSDGVYGRAIKADTREEAMAIADEEGWTLEGEIAAVIPADQISSEQADEIINAMNERGDSQTH